MRRRSSPHSPGAILALAIAFMSKRDCTAGSRRLGDALWPPLRAGLLSAVFLVTISIAFFRCGGGGAHSCFHSSECSSDDTCVFTERGCSLPGKCKPPSPCGAGFLDTRCGCDGKVVNGVCAGGWDGPVNPVQTCMDADAGSADAATAD
jgi:hypothetical protein